MIILCWNRDQGETWSEEDFDTAFAECAEDGASDSDWSVGRHINIDEGQDCFLLIQGTGHPRGLVAYGIVTSNPWEGEHYLDPSKTLNYVDVQWRAMRPIDEPVPMEVLKEEVPDVPWSGGIRESGYTVNPLHEEDLRRVWARHHR